MPVSSNYNLLCLNIQLIGTPQVPSKLGQLGCSSCYNDISSFSCNILTLPSTGWELPAFLTIEAFVVVWGFLGRSSSSPFKYFGRNSHHNSQPGAGVMLSRCLPPSCCQCYNVSGQTWLCSQCSLNSSGPRRLHVKLPTNCCAPGQL